MLGAIYLVWIGIGIIRTKLGGATPDMPEKTVKRALFDSFMVEILNPKVALFFIALLPQFVDPAGSVPVWLQFLILGTIVNMANTSADLVAVYSASKVMQKVAGSSSRAFDIARWGAGSAMIGLGVKLAADRT
jgi:threonine/homoserine/homoserine lactone efflux protein